jgi:hypothetical protein
VPPLLPCEGFTGGVLPEPPDVPGPLAPPPDPPGEPFVISLPPLPPPVDVIVEKTEFDPLAAQLAKAFGAPAVPPAPTEIGYVCTEIGKPPVEGFG